MLILKYDAFVNYTYLQKIVIQSPQKKITHPIISTSFIIHPSAPSVLWTIFYLLSFKYLVLLLFYSLKKKILVKHQLNISTTCHLRKISLNNTERGELTTAHDLRVFVIYLWRKKNNKLVLLDLFVWRWTAYINSLYLLKSSCYIDQFIYLSQKI